MKIKSYRNGNLEIFIEEVVDNNFIIVLQYVEQGGYDNTLRTVQHGSKQSALTVFKNWMTLIDELIEMN